MMIRNLNLNEYSFDRKKAYLELNKSNVDNMTNEEIESEFSRLSRFEKRKEERIIKETEENQMKNEAKTSSTLKELIKDLKQGQSRVYTIDELKLKIQVKLVGKVEPKVLAKTDAKK